VVNGESIKSDLEEIFKVSGKPRAIVKDTDYTLNTGIRLYTETQKEPISLIKDISHVVAKSLKKEFEDRVSFRHPSFNLIIFGY